MNTIRFFSPIQYLYQVRSELSYHGKILFKISFYLVYTVEHVYSSLWGYKGTGTYRKNATQQLV